MDKRVINSEYVGKRFSISFKKQICLILIYFLVFNQTFVGSSVLLAHAEASKEGQDTFNPVHQSFLPSSSSQSDQLDPAENIFIGPLETTTAELPEIQSDRNESQLMRRLLTRDGKVIVLKGPKPGTAEYDNFNRLTPAEQDLFLRRRDKILIGTAGFLTLIARTIVARAIKGAYHGLAVGARSSYRFLKNGAENVVQSKPIQKIRESLIPLKYGIFRLSKNSWLTQRLWMKKSFFDKFSQQMKSGSQPDDENRNIEVEEVLDESQRTHIRNEFLQIVDRTLFGSLNVVTKPQSFHFEMDLSTILLFGLRGVNSRLLDWINEHGGLFTFMIRFSFDAKTGDIVFSFIPSREKMEEVVTLAAFLGFNVRAFLGVGTHEMQKIQSQKNDRPSWDHPTVTTVTTTPGPFAVVNNAYLILFGLNVPLAVPAVPPLSEFTSMITTSRETGFWVNPIKIGNRTLLEGKYLPLGVQGRIYQLNMEQMKERWAKIRSLLGSDWLEQIDPRVLLNNGVVSSLSEGLRLKSMYETVRNILGPNVQFQLPHEGVGSCQRVLVNNSN